MKLIPKNQGGNKLGASTVTTPNYTKITPRTYFLEGKRTGFIPQEIKMTEFVGNMSKFAPKSSDYKYDATTGEFFKNAPLIQALEEDKTNLKQLGKSAPKGTVTGGYVKKIISKKTGGKIENNILDTLIPSLQKLINQ